jgi:hypothetical protein
LDADDVPNGEYVLLHRTWFRAAGSSLTASDGVYLIHDDDVLVLDLESAVSVEVGSEAGVLMDLIVMRYY